MSPGVLAGQSLDSHFYVQNLSTECVALAKKVPIKKKFLFEVTDVEREEKLWKKVSSNKHFFSLLGSFDLGSEHYFVLENVPSTSLFNLTEGSEGLSQSDVVPLAAQLILAVGWLHCKGIIHRTLRPEVLWVDWKGLLRIGDLSSCQSKGKNSTLLGSSVSFPYIAPEVLKGHSHGESADWWSVGGIIFYLLRGRNFYSCYQLDSLYRKISKKCCKEALEDIIRLPVVFSGNMSKEAQHLLSGLLNKNEDHRMQWNRQTNLAQIMDEPFFENIDWVKLSSSTSVGGIQMDLSTSLWHLNQLNVHQSLGADFGRIYSKAYVVTHRKSAESATMKMVWKARMRGTADGWKDVMNERLVWQKVSDHPYILPLVSFFETEATYCFIAQKLELGACCLSTVIKSAPLPDEVIKVMAGQLALALSFVHEKGVLIRNLTSDSILVDGNGYMRLANFDQAKETEFSRKRVASESAFMSPEVIQRQCYGREADWWAFGIILFEMFTGTNPLQIYCLSKGIQAEGRTSTEVLLRAVEGIPKVLKSGFTGQARQLLADLLEPIPSERLGFKRQAFHQIKRHSFFRGLKWKSLEHPS